jgi:hypothetical protein
MGLLATSQVHFIFPNLEVCHELIFIPIIKRGKEGGDLHCAFPFFGAWIWAIGSLGVLFYGFLS